MRRALLLLASLCACGDDPSTREDSDGTSSGAGGVGGSAASSSSQGSSASGGSTGECAPGATESCYGGPAGTLGVGPCTAGTRTCQLEAGAGVWGACVGWTGPGVEICGDGVDDDCDGPTDEDCCTPTAESCNATDDDCDGSFDEDGVCDIVSTCALGFPPAASVPCDVPAPGAQYYVSSGSGSDSNAGDDPDKPWATLQHAVNAAPGGATVRVAQGHYGALNLVLAKDLTLKGGYDATFASWDPDLHASVFSGRLTVNHDEAVVAGMRLVAMPQGQPNTPFDSYHRLAAGALVRNYVQIVFQAGAGNGYFYAIVASADAGKTTRLACNDIYVRTDGQDLWSPIAVAYGQLAYHRGDAFLDSNRICFDGGPEDHPRAVVSGTGSLDSSSHVAITNNVLENAHTGPSYGEVVAFTPGDADLVLALTNNTLLTRQDGVTGYGVNSTGSVTWRLTNNVVAKLGAAATGSRAVWVGSGSDNVTIESSEHNLTFGFGDNDISPLPELSVGDDTNGLATPTSVFVDALGGDLQLTNGGQATGTAMNVYGLPSYGAVTHDLQQKARPASGAWDRGALAK